MKLIHIPSSLSHTSLTLLLIAILAIKGAVRLSAQTQSENYIITKTWLNADSSASLDNIDYYDQLGRLEETVQKGASPNGSDIATLKQYDPYSRLTNEWLPAVTASAEGEYVAPDAFTSQAVSTNSDESPFTTHTYETSPLSRQTFVLGPGSAWKNNNKGVRTEYGTNDLQSNKVMLFTLDAKKWNNGNCVFTNKGYYLPGQLDKVTTTDEDDHKTTVFTDVLGHKILERRYNDGENIDTYYIYSSNGSLLLVLPPLAIDKVSTKGQQYDAVKDLGSLAYVYCYDPHMRVKAKKLPGQGWTRYAYNQNDQLILERMPSGTVKFHIPDALGRVCVEGVCKMDSAKMIEYSENGLGNVYAGIILDLSKIESADDMELTDKTGSSLTDKNYRNGNTGPNKGNGNKGLQPVEFTNDNEKIIFNKKRFQELQSTEETYKNGNVGPNKGSGNTKLQPVEYTSDDEDGSSDSGIPFKNQQFPGITANNNSADTDNESGGNGSQLDDNNTSIIKLNSSLRDSLNATRKKFDPNGIYRGYSVNGLELSKPKLTKVIYYDDYTYFKKNLYPDSLNNAFQKTAQKYDNRSESIAKGRVTGSISSVLGDSVTNERIYSTVYYNNRGEENVIYQSNLLGGYDVTSMERGYLGNITSKYCEHHSVAGVIKEQFDYTYDHHQRLVNESYTLNDKSMGNIIHNEYDALGRLGRSRQGSSSCLQRTYAYNVRSQLTSSASPLFTEKIYYESPRNNGVTPCFNGDISSVSWSEKTAIAKTSDMMHYDYSYDALDRLTGSSYSDYENRTGFYDTGYIYDKQGNILGFTRTNVDPTDKTKTKLVDDASFRYDGNQLMAYSDIGMETSSQDITLPDNYDDIDGSDQFSYDACGNMTANTNKGIVKMTYNLLNQPASIYFRNGTVIRYDYSADGERLRARYGTVKYNVAIPEAGIMAADFQPSDTTGYSMTSSDIYDGRYTYRSYYKRSRYAKYKTYKTSLSRIRIDGGIVTDFSAGNPSLLFELADHQGNIRYVADANGAMETLYQYYPFGGYFEGVEGGMKCSHPYLYGGKEMEKSNGLDEYDFEARNYDPALCRFNTMDPLSEKYYSISPYAYCADNPIRYVDPSGKVIYPILFETTDNHGFAVGTLYWSTTNYMKAMQMFGETNYGRQFIGSFLKQNESWYGVQGNGKYSEYVFRIEEYRLSNVNDQFLFMSNKEGSFSADEIDGQLNIILKLDVKGKAVDELAEIISHELALHGSEVDNIIKTYKEGGIDAVQKLLAKDPHGDMDHRALVNNDMKHEGVVNYNKIRAEMTRNHPSVKKVFERAQKFYKDEFGN